MKELSSREVRRSFPWAKAEASSRRACPEERKVEGPDRNHPLLVMRSQRLDVSSRASLRVEGPDWSSFLSVGHHKLPLRLCASQRLCVKSGARRAVKSGIRNRKPKSAILAIFLCIACSHEAPHLQVVEAPKLDPGWSALKSDDATVTLGIPPTFHNALLRETPIEIQPTQQVAPPDPDTDLSVPPPTPPPTDDANQKLMDSLNNMQTGLQDGMYKQTLADMQKKGYLVWAWQNGRAPAGEERTQMSVKKIPAPGSDLDQIGKEARVGMGGSATNATTEKINLPIGPAMKVTTDFQNRIGDQVTEIRYLLLDGNDEYIVRFYAENGKEQIQPISDSVMETLRITPKA